MNEESAIPDAYLIEIGRVAVNWNHLESIMHLCMINLLGKSLEDPRAHAVFLHMAFPQKLDVLSAMIAEIILPDNHPLKRYAQDIQPLLKAAQRDRNATLHQKWGIENGVVVRSDITARGTLAHTRTAVKLIDLQRASASSMRAAAVLFNATVGSATDNDTPQSGQ